MGDFLGSIDIKVLTDLEKLLDAFSIDIKDLTDLKKRRNKALYRH